MGKLSEKFKGALEKWKAFSIAKKIGLSVLVFGIAFSLVALSLYAGSTKYGVLFSNMDSTDSKVILDKLKTLKVTNKVQGNSILVPADQVDSLRLQLTPDITNGSKGFELFDSTSQFGMTDQQMSITYQRALEGELEKTLKGFPQVEGARVHLVMQDETAFVTDSTPASASVTLKLKSGTNLTQSQVKAIIALISGSVKGLPKENVDIVDDKMKLLSAGIYSSDTTDTSSSDSAEANQKQQQQKANYEKSLEDKAMAMVSTIAPSGNVKVKVNADLDFNAVSTDKVEVSPGAAVSSKTTKSTTTGGNSTTSSQSPTGSNASSSSVSYPSPSQTGSTSSSEETTVNNEVGKTETKTVVAPGQVKRLTASVIFDGTLSDEDKTQIKDLVSNAIGLDEVNRKDSITIVGMHFDTTSQDKTKSDLAQIDALNKKTIQNKMYGEIGIALGGVIVLGILLFSLKKKSQKDVLETVKTKKGKSLDVVIDEAITPKEVVEEKIFEPIDFEPDKEKVHLEKELIKYAKEKPDQVSDVVKAWIAEDER